MSNLNQMAFNQEVALMEYLSDSVFIAKLVGYCKEPVCLILKYYPSGSLDNWLVRDKQVVGRHSIIYKFNIFHDVARGVAVMHERQVAHCDLKPQNILVEERTDRTYFILTDFGISKVLTEEYLASKAFQIRNLRGLTIAYAAPDALKRFRQKNVFGTPREEKAADTYSLACVFYFALTKLSPFE
jgi:serine/threonine protein kinase